MAKLGEYGEILETMTAQEVFDVACEHLITQNKRSMDSDDDSCLYKGDGVCCAAAPFIKEYSDKLEGLPWWDVRHTESHELLICDLQSIHDGYPPSDWKEALEFLVKREGLQVPDILKGK